jgi:hypothetical protein
MQVWPVGERTAWEAGSFLACLAFGEIAEIHVLQGFQPVLKAFFTLIYPPKWLLPVLLSGWFTVDNENDTLQLCITSCKRGVYE